MSLKPPPTQHALTATAASLMPPADSRWLWALLMAGVVHLIIPFPQPWGALVFAGTSIAVQMSTPWYNSDERLETA